VAPDGLIVIGGSAGSLDGLTSIVARLPRDLPAAVLVVVHLPATAESLLPAIIERAGQLPARHPRSGDTLVPGTILVAPPDHHLLVQDGRVQLSRGPRENRHRPAVDATLRSAVRSYGTRVAGVILSGALWDGAGGTRLVIEAGGHAFVQEPTEAPFPQMPREALEATGAESLPVALIGERLVNLARSWDGSAAALQGKSVEMGAKGGNSHDARSAMG
jgi:two-component system, chemotaxis family, protein-glutamate methylesterase/glutaminase